MAISSDYGDKHKQWMEASNWKMGASFSASNYSEYYSGANNHSESTFRIVKKMKSQIEEPNVYQFVFVFLVYCWLSKEKMRKVKMLLNNVVGAEVNDIYKKPFVEAKWKFPYSL